MDTKTLFSYPRHVLSHYKGRILSAGKRLLSNSRTILFVFGGREQHWAGMGGDLYSSEKVFRECIQQCDAVIQCLGEKSILPNFEKKAAPDFFEDEANVVFVLLSFQIALYELLKSKGILPNAVVGVSLGEISAVYAAGAISLESALKVGTIGIALSRKEKKEYYCFLLQSTWTEAKKILEKSPVRLLPVQERSENSTLIFVHKGDQKTAKEFLNGEAIKYRVVSSHLLHPYHTELIVKHEELVKTLVKGIIHKPLQCDFFSTTLGRVAPEGAILEKDFWFNTLHRPMLTHTVLKQLSATDYKTLVHINTPYFSDNDLRSQTSQAVPFRSLYTVLAGKPELDLYKSTENRLRKTSRQPSSLSRYTKNEIQAFRERISFAEPQFYQDPLPYLRYLQQHGNVHYLPRQNEWIVTEYALAEYVLKTPEIFSSSIHQSFDEFLLGADPPSHTFVRSLMQPFFTQQRFNMMAQYTSLKANALLEKLKRKNKFNLVEEFSIPLSQAVLARFMGFSEEEECALQNTIKQLPYGLQFFDDLKEFSKQYLQNLRTSDENKIGSALLGFVKEDQISFDTAVSLLQLLCVAGIITTSILVSSAVLLLFRHPSLLQQVKEDEQLLNKFIEECLRLEAPESEVKRITTRQVELDGQIIPKGAMVVLKINAMNRDQNHFEDPDSIDVNRYAKKHLSFSAGYHFCMGAGMARAEAKMAIKAILENFRVLKIDQGEIEYFPSSHFRALQKLVIICEEANA